MTTKTPNEAAEKLEKDLGLPDRFFKDVFKEDDWSFIIKMHAIFEAAATYILVHKTRNQQLEEIFSNIELSNKKTGKIAFLRAYNVLETEERGYISMLSKIRNSLVHNIKNVNFKIDSYVVKMDSNERKNFVKFAGYAYPDYFEIEGKRIEKSQFVIENPKRALWETGIFILAVIYISKEIEELKQRAEESKRKFYEVFLR